MVGTRLQRACGQPPRASGERSDSGMANPRTELHDPPVLRADVPRTRAELRAVGISDSCLGREHTRLLRGQWLHGAVAPEARHFLLAALQRSPDDAFLTRQTAAAVHGGVVPSEGVIHVGTASDRRVRTPGMTLHRYAQRPDVVMVDGLPVTTKPQTFVDLGAVLGLVDLVVLGDSFSRGAPGMPEELRRHTAASHGRGVVAARSAATLVRVGAESAQETRTRLLMVLAGLPEPVLQHPMYDVHGHQVHRLDMAHPDALLAIEYDGDHHLDRRQRDRDLLRREKFEASGWRFVIAVTADIHQRPAPFLDRVVVASRERGIAVPKRLDPRWQLHFGR